MADSFWYWQVIENQRTQLTAELFPKHFGIYFQLYQPFIAMKNQLLIPSSIMKNKTLVLFKNRIILPILILGFIISNPIASNNQCINPADLPMNILDVCFGEEVTFCPVDEGEDVCYKWLPENAFRLGESTYPNPTTLKITEDMEIQLIKTDNDGNILEEVTINVVVNDFNLELVHYYTICNGQSTTLEVNPTGGSGDYLYEWNTGETTSSITVAPTETALYTVKTQDVEEGCSLITSHYVTVNPSPETSITASNPSICLLTLPGLTNDPNGEKKDKDNSKAADCTNNSVGLSVDSEEDLTGYTYIWSTTETSSTISVEEPGEYSVTISNGTCISTAFIEITSCAEVNVELDLEYNGQEWVSILDAGEGFDSYEWEDGSLERTVAITEPGEYSVTVYSNGCVATDKIVVPCKYSFEKVKEVLCGSYPAPFHITDIIDCGAGVIPNLNDESYIISSTISFYYGGEKHQVTVTGKETATLNYSNYHTSVDL